MSERIFKYLVGDQFEESQFDSVNMETYTGSRREVYDKDGITSQEDDRELFHEKALKLNDFKRRAMLESLEKAPIFDQLNALAGRLSIAKVNSINTHISAVRQKYAGYKTQILDAVDLDELDDIRWS